MDIRPFIRELVSKSIYPTLQSLSKGLGDRIEKAIQSKESPTAFEITNQDEISSPIIEALSDAQNATVRAIESIPRVEIPTTDFSQLEAKMEAVKEAIQKKEMSVNVGKTKVDVDTKSVVKAIEKLQDSLKKEEPKEQEVIDYTLIMDEMCHIMEKPHYALDLLKIQDSLNRIATTDDMGVIAEYLQALINKKHPEFPELKFTKDGELLVKVDRVGGGGGGGLTQIETDALLSLATEETLALLNAKDLATSAKQLPDGHNVTVSNPTANPETGLAKETTLQALSGSSDPLSKYKFADLDDDASPNYYGAVSVTGSWYILKEDTTAKTLRYATGASAYTTAWTGRASQVYDYLFNVTLS